MGNLQGRIDSSGMPLREPPKYYPDSIIRYTRLRHSRLTTTHTVMDVNATNLLANAMQRFEQAAVKTVASAQGLSSGGASTSDLSTDLINLSTAGQTVKAVAATVSVESELQRSALDIIA